MWLRTTFLFFCLQQLCSLSAAGQQDTGAFANEIAAFTRADQASRPPSGTILFVGSSSIRLWPALAQDFDRHKVLNRGFGGATIPDVARYAEATIYRYQPRQIVFYCGENDLASSDTITSATVVKRFTDLFSQIRKRLPRSSFVFISIKPSPSRRHLLPKVVATNKAIRSFLAGQPNTRYVDVYTRMFDDQGQINGALFTADSLHMNAGGYAIWKQSVRPVLK